MLDQNITTLLAALLGGLLSIIGGFVANYYIQSSSDRIQKKKEIRNILEHIYKSTQIIETNYSSLITGIAVNEAEKRISEIIDSLRQIERNVNLYLPPLGKNFTEYQNEIITNIADADRNVSIEDSLEKHYFKMPGIDVANKEFRASLTKMLKDKGYSYF